MFRRWAISKEKKFRMINREFTKNNIKRIVKNKNMYKNNFKQKYL